MARTRTLKLAATAAAAAVVAILAATPAGATVVERGTYTDTYSREYDDCGFRVLRDGTASGHFTVRAGKGKTDTAFFLNDNFSYSETHTNADTGASITVTGNAIWNEIKATRVEGNIFEFTAVEAGQTLRIYDSAGNLVLRDRGSAHYHALFDTGGDDEPGAEFIADLGVDVHGPHPGFDPQSFCEAITPLIGS